MMALIVERCSPWPASVLTSDCSTDTSISCSQNSPKTGTRWRRKKLRNTSRLPARSSGDLLDRIALRPGGEADALGLLAAHGESITTVLRARPRRMMVTGRTDCSTIQARISAAS